jgi:hypothetical protein
MFKTVDDFVRRCPDPSKISLKIIRFTNFDTETTDIFERNKKTLQKKE